MSAWDPFIGRICKAVYIEGDCTVVDFESPTVLQMRFPRVTDPSVRDVEAEQVKVLKDYLRGMAAVN